MSGTVPVTLAAEDDFGVVAVELYEGTTLLGTDTSAPFSVNWNLLLLPKGQHTLTVTAQDSAGHVTTSAPVLVTVQ